MNSLATGQPCTPEELLTHRDGKGYEIVRGRAVECVRGSLASFVGGVLFRWLAAHCDRAKLGWVWPAGNGYQCFPHAADMLRRPSVSFIRAGRLPDGRPARGYERLAPDLVAEVVSPNDSGEEVEQRVDDYLRAGVRLVWVLYPATRTVHVFRPDGSARRLRETDTLDGEDVVPGFSSPVSELCLTAAPPA